ncbi:MAG TPA: cytochrome c peroxidase [Steroidobacteraceae bacterium]|jgi:cytochrome c peroxidase|nr:cytochrome c peroxidase [Steroidobacteraceae bacterium]
MKPSIKVRAPGMTAVLYLACTAGAGPSLAADPATGPHGAMPIPAQEQRLDKLITRYTSPPAGIDPVAWASIYMMTGNELTPDRIALGRKLYFDTRLSKDGTLACATCHDVSRGFSDHRSVSEGIGDHLGKRSAPTTMNAALLQSQFWDGRAPSLEEQAKLPILNPIEMGHPDADSAMASIKTDPSYGAMFQKAYGRAPNYDDLGRAIASFERTLIFLDAPFDRFAAGDAKAMSSAAQRGLDLFNGKARCVSCHMINSSNPLGTDNLFHNIGVSVRTKNFEALAGQALGVLSKNNDPKALDKLAIETDMSELGRFLVTRNRGDIGAFKTEQVRNVGLTAPYMHDGSLKTLWDVVDHYNKGGETNAYLDGGIEPLNLTENEINDVVAFLFALTDTRFAAENEAAFREQQAIAAKSRPLRDNALAHREMLPFEQRVMGPAGLK